MAVRRPAFAGAFYDANSISLKKQITNCFLHKFGPRRLPQDRQDADLVSVVAPHAGYVYSGACAAHAFLELGEMTEPETVIVIGPNHTGWGTPISVMGEGSWETPLGSVELDTEFANKLVENSEVAQLDSGAFRREHSIEVQVPFLQFIYDNFRLVPICMGYQDLVSSIDLGKAIHESIGDKSVVIVASSDLNHQEPKQVSNRKDRMVLDEISEMDEVGLQNVVKEERISTCGYGPVSATLVASKLGGAKSAEILSYYTSGDIIGDDRSVVGYASAKISKGM